MRDLFEQFETSGLFDKDLAQRYRKCILEPGGTRDAADMVREFLGRDYRLKAFQDWVNEQ